MDTIAQMLTKIRNAQRAGKKDVLIGASNLKLTIARVLEKESFIQAVSEEVGQKGKNLKIDLKYYRISNARKIPAIKDIQKISREGQRIYVKNKEIKNVRNNFGVAIISTPRGIMTGAEAKKSGLGGEHICNVW